MNRSDDGRPRSLNLQRYVPALISILENKLTNTASAVYRKQFGIGATEMRIIVQLGQQPRLSGSQIGQAAAVDKAAVSRALKSLHRLGLITISASRGRAQSIALTRAGLVLHQKGVELSLLREQHLLAGLSASERESVVRLLDRMLSNTPLLSAAAEKARSARTLRQPAAAAPA